MTDQPVSPELALVDPELRRQAIEALPDEPPRPAVRPPAVAIVRPQAWARLPVAATVYAAVVLGRILTAGLALAALLILLVVVTLLVR
jgi:hypothetical protein